MALCGIFIKDNKPISFGICSNLGLKLPNCEDLWIELQQKTANV